MQLILFLTMHFLWIAIKLYCNLQIAINWYCNLQIAINWYCQLHIEINCHLLCTNIPSNTTAAQTSLLWLLHIFVLLVILTVGNLQLLVE